MPSTHNFQNWEISVRFFPREQTNCPKPLTEVTSLPISFHLQHLQWSVWWGSPHILARDGPSFNPINVQIFNDPPQKYPEKAWSNVNTGTKMGRKYSSCQKLPPGYNQKHCGGVFFTLSCYCTINSKSPFLMFSGQGNGFCKCWVDKPLLGTKTRWCV